jgi:amidohydrolase
MPLKKPGSIPQWEAIRQLRHQLHRQPELSGKEHKTARLIAQHFQRFKPANIITDLGGTGVAVVLQGQQPGGPTILFRAELDALPITETSSAPHTSENTGISHSCGHDGHMAILAGTAELIQQEGLPGGKVILLFQPAEETGAGARGVLQDERFLGLKPDYVFALHNLPAVPLHQVVVRQEVFAAASTGMIVEFTGKSSHAAEPENGLNPGVAMAELVLALNAITADKSQFQELALLTVIHARLGEIAFGTNPGFATVMATLRAYQPPDFTKLKQLATQAAEAIARKHELTCKLEFVEEFPVTCNDKEAISLVEQAARELELDVQEAVHPFRWSEDFGHFTAKYKGAFFGLGAGLAQPQLHHADYDFPDELIPTAARLFYTIAQKILNT